MTKFKWLKDDKYVKQRSFENLSHLRLSFLFSLGLLDLDLKVHEVLLSIPLLLGAFFLTFCLSFCHSSSPPCCTPSSSASWSGTYLGHIWAENVEVDTMVLWWINFIMSPVPSFCHRFFLDLFLHLSGLPQVAWVQQRLKTRSKWIQLQNETMQRFHSV